MSVPAMNRATLPIQHTQIALTNCAASAPESTTTVFAPPALLLWDAVSIPNLPPRPTNQHHHEEEEQNREEDAQVDDLYILRRRPAVGVDKRQREVFDDLVEGLVNDRDAQADAEGGRGVGGAPLASEPGELEPVHHLPNEDCVGRRRRRAA